MSSPTSQWPFYPQPSSHVDDKLNRIAESMRNSRRNHNRKGDPNHPDPSKRGDLDAARIEYKGGTTAFKRSGERYQHDREVKDTQRGYKRDIASLRRMLGQNITPEQRRRAQALLSFASRQLDYTEKYIPSSPRKELSFKQNLQQTRLTDSYNSTHQDKPVPPKPGASGTIGGVACSAEFIEGLFESPEAFFEGEHYFCVTKFCDGSVPFSDQELRQILRELALGVYVYETFPFFSLHFSQDGLNLFPVIHPAYADTLVGRVIGLLDYFMKGYLNGVTFSEEFIDSWHTNPSWKDKSASALQQMINLERYCADHLEGEDRLYKSAREDKEVFDAVNQNRGLLSVLPEDLRNALSKKMMGAEEESDVLNDFSGFRNSFRIISKQESVSRSGNLLMIEPDFDVLYTIEPSPQYEKEFEKYVRKNGVEPTSYQVMVQIYEMMQKRIYDHMVKMPLCRKYFAMLGVIHFFASYFATLKQHRKVPTISMMALDSRKGCPPLFPHLPLPFTAKQSLSCNMGKVVKQFFDKYRATLKEFVENRLAGLFTFRIESEMKSGFKEIFRQEICKSYSETFKRYIRTQLEEDKKHQERIDDLSNKVFDQIFVSFERLGN